MPDNNDQSVLRRKLRQGEPTTPPAADMSPGRALRLALSRAADRTVGLRLTVLGLTDDIMTLDEVVDQLSPDHMILSATTGADSGADLLGLLAVDPELRSCLIEIQTMGALSTAAATPRGVTAADAALATPVMVAFLAMLNETATGTQLAGWAADTTIGPPLEGPRAAGLALPDGAYRLVRLSLDFAAGERQGELCLALPQHRNPRAAPKDGATCAAWAAAFNDQVQNSHANLNAVLHRIRLPVSQIEAFELGQVIPLAGTRVTSIKLVGADGRIVTTARLGQMAGQRAVRVETTNRATLDPTDDGVPHTALTPTAPIQGVSVSAPAKADPANSEQPNSAPGQTAAAQTDQDLAKASS